MEQRYIYIDRLKGLSIILVVIGHILSFSMIGGRNPYKYSYNLLPHASLYVPFRVSN